MDLPSVPTCSIISSILMGVILLHSLAMSFTSAWANCVILFLLSTSSKKEIVSGSWRLYVFVFQWSLRPGFDFVGKIIYFWYIIKLAIWEGHYLETIPAFIYTIEYSMQILTHDGMIIFHWYNQRHQGKVVPIQSQSMKYFNQLACLGIVMIYGNYLMLKIFMVIMVDAFIVWVCLHIYPRVLL